METNNQIQLVTETQLTGYLTAMGLAPTLTDKEKMQFLEIARAYNLNPFKREIYCTKYGNTFSIIVGYESYIKRAERSGLLNGWSVRTEGVGNELKAIVTIHRKDFAQPFEHEVYYSEYVQYKNEGTVQTFWKNKPITMTKKVAISQAFRMCFSSEIGGMPYTAEEIVENEAIYVEAIEVKDCGEAIEAVKNCKTQDELKKVWSDFKDLQKEVEFINAKNSKKDELK